MTKVRTQTNQLIHGPAGQLEIETEVATGNDRLAWGIICHPHPLHGGSMQNKVVTTLAKTFQFLGVSTVRFNFRGVGKSTGEFDYGKGELDDLFAIVNWVQQEHPQHEIWLGGFSFGAYIAAKAATEIPVKKLAVIAPPIQDYLMETLPPILCDWVIAQGEKDDVVSPATVFEWAENRYPQPIILRFPEADHFFHGKLIELRMQLEEALR